MLDQKSPLKEFLLILGSFFYQFKFVNLNAYEIFKLKYWVNLSW